MRAPIFQTCSLQFHTYLSPPPHSFLEGAQHITRLLLGVHYATGRSLIQKIFKYPFNAISLLVYQLLRGNGVGITFSYNEQWNVRNLSEIWYLVL